MSFNQRLRKNMAEKGPQAAKKWEERLEENALRYNASENQRAEEIVRDFKKQRNFIGTLDY